MQGVCEQQFSSLATGAQQDLSRAVCLRSNLLPILKSFAAFNKFSSRFAPCLHPSIFPSALSSFPFPAGEKCAHSMMLPPPCFTAGIVFSNQCTVLHKGPKIQFWSHLTRAPLLCPLHGLWQTSYGFLSTMASVLTLFYNSQIWGVQIFPPVNLCSSSRVNVGLLAASLIKALWLACQFTVGGLPYLRVKSLRYGFALFSYVLYANSPVHPVYFFILPSLSTEISNLPTMGHRQKSLYYTCPARKHKLQKLQN